jgi:membrane protein
VKRFLSRTVAFVRTLAGAWSEDHCSRKAAALAYYTAFSLAPILVIVLWLVGLVADAKAASEELRTQLTALVGPAGEEALDSLLVHTLEESKGFAAALVALPVLLLGATTAFTELKESLDEIWGVKAEAQSGLWGFLRTRLLSFGMILVIAFLLLVSLAANAGVAVASKALVSWIGLGGTVALQALSTLMSLLVVMTIFAAIYKLLPATELRWRDVARASLVTTVLFLLGQLAIGLYLGNSATANAYGAAGSLAVLMLWIYYSTSVFFLGAELNKFWLHLGRQKAARAQRARKPTLTIARADTSARSS